MDYKNDKRFLELVRVEEGTGQSPFFNTYHNLDMNCDRVSWDMKTAKIRFGSDTSYSGASSIALLSDNYFSKNVYDRLGETYPRHPLRI